jgi:hypothetical protein
LPFVDAFNRSFVTFEAILYNTILIFYKLHN